ncbi:hypothetical protein HUN08_09790 [Gordonia sp. X0973]|uniref:YncE family protein n=1 Tax=Gordonia sp. X0973 TaxID=2742602 RepID=UPI001581A7A1|nr:PQQ-binding-like beta-propeller repeat protein [Gordonia sp. X0973]QKT07453.1 hypothetical protein HUN08_09790 [Gordonia sp. X0973]
MAVYAGGDLNGAPVRTETPPMRAITADRDGFVAVGEKSVVRIGVRPTPATVVALARPGLAVAVDGNRVYVGTEDGHLLILDDRLHQVGDVGGLVRVDGVAVGQRNGAPQIVVLDRAQSLVTTINPNSSGRGAALRAGNGATTLVADHYGRFTVANTGDGQILGFYGEPLINRFRFPLPDGPYGLAYDDQRNLLWVSQTAVNRVTAFDLSAGEPRERTRFASVRQPDSIAVDPTSGAVYVLSATGDGLQRVTR